MLISTSIVGRFDPTREASDAVDFVEIPWADASKRRLRRPTKSGLDFAISLEHSEYLFHGAVLLNDGEHVVVVNRPKEAALIIDLGQNSKTQEALQRAALIGHAFGNQHIPIEVDNFSILVPVLTSESVMEKTIRDLGLGELPLRFGAVRLGISRPLVVTGHAHG